MKTCVLIGAAIGGLLGSLAGGILDHGTMLGVWGITMSTIGGAVGIFAGYRIYTYGIEG